MANKLAAEANSPTPISSDDGHDHLVPLPLYFAIFGALLIGTALTVWAAFQDFGWLNTPVALGIAVTKATLVVLFFMHVRYSENLVQLFAAFAFFAVAVFIAIILTDYTTRQDLEGWQKTPILTVSVPNFTDAGTPSAATVAPAAEVPSAADAPSAVPTPH